MAMFHPMINYPRPVCPADFEIRCYGGFFRFLALWNCLKKKPLDILKKVVKSKIFNRNFPFTLLSISIRFFPFLFSFLPLPPLFYLPSLSSAFLPLSFPFFFFFALLFLSFLLSFYSFLPPSSPSLFFIYIVIIELKIPKIQRKRFLSSAYAFD